MWLVTAVAVTLLVAYQAGTTVSRHGTDAFVAQADAHAVRFADVLREYSLPIDQASGAEPVSTRPPG
jgi:hypothetical protein